MTIEDIIRHRLVDLKPTSLEIINDSHKHRGHAAAGLNTHFHLKIISAKFIGLSMIKRHQLVYHLLKNEMNNPIHALQLTTKSPEEQV